MDLNESESGIPDIVPIEVEDTEPPTVQAVEPETTVLGDEPPAKKAKFPHPMTEKRKKALAKARAMRSLKHEMAKKEKLESAKTIHDLTAVIADMRDQLETLSSKQRSHFEKQESAMNNIPRQSITPRYREPEVPKAPTNIGYKKLKAQDISF